MKILFLALAMTLTMTSIQANAGWRTLPCGARTSDDMEKPKRVARNDWALPGSKAAAAQQRPAATARAADATPQDKHP